MTNARTRLQKPVYFPILQQITFSTVLFWWKESFRMSWIIVNENLTCDWVNLLWFWCIETNWYCLCLELILILTYVLCRTLLLPGKRKKMLKNFKIWPFYWSFSSETMAVKRLRGGYWSGVRMHWWRRCLVQSFKVRRGLLLTQLPLPDTVVDLWRLVESREVNTIVSLGAKDEDMTVKVSQCF